MSVDYFVESHSSFPAYVYCNFISKCINTFFCTISYQAMNNKSSWFRSEKDFHFKIYDTELKKVTMQLNL